MGHSTPFETGSEIRRQSIEAAMVEPITERLLRAAAVRPGMRVLDLGCGGGDSSMLAAELVGLTGSVVGIDRSAEVVMVARRRVRAVGHANIEFRWDSAEEFYDPLPFDAVIGRYVLVHQADPERFLRAATSHVKPGGILAFHEAAMYGQLYCLPAVPLMQQVWDWMVAAYASLAPCDRR
jgi:2-polyprenyl-3-methyl-5-hydroxy-6-metoxy-1,4-benzoquinol methylase